MSEKKVKSSMTQNDWTEPPEPEDGKRSIKQEEETEDDSSNEAFSPSPSGYGTKYHHRCSICSKLFRDVQSLRRHVKSEVCAIPIQCSHCPKIYFGKRRLQKHVYNCHRAAGVFQCAVCGREFAKKDHLNRHMCTHNSEAPYACPNCPRRYKGERQLECHMFTHHKISKRENFRCEMCGKLFVRRETLDCHVCADPQVFVCDECGGTFGTKHELKQHIWRMHLSHLPHHCATCGKEFVTASELKQHQVVHQVERPFQCSGCGGSFKTKRHLLQHAAMCLSERKVKACFVCGDVFASDSELAQHKKAHAREGRHPCALCENSYKKRSYLRLHVMRQHGGGERSFACEVCGKAFLVQGDLRQHAIVHSDARPFSCEKCGRAYKQKQALQRHLTTFHLMRCAEQGLPLS